MGGHICTSPSRKGGRMSTVSRHRSWQSQSAIRCACCGDRDICADSGSSLALQGQFWPGAGFVGVLGRLWPGSLRAGHHDSQRWLLIWDQRKFEVTMTTLQTKKKERIRGLLWRCQSRQPGRQEAPLGRAGEAQPRRRNRRKRLGSGEKSEEGERVSTG